MKKTLYFLPFIFWSILYLFAGFAVSFDSIDFTVYIGLILLLVSGILMSRNNWWGSITCIYYIICLIITYKSKK